MLTSLNKRKCFIVILLMLLLFSLSACKKKHEHSIVKMEAKEVTCTEDGSILFYSCSECGKSFSDSEGKYEIIIGKDTVIEHTGHQYDNNCDKQCNNCEETRDVYHIDQDENDICDNCGINVWGDDSGVDLPIDKQ